MRSDGPRPSLPDPPRLADRLRRTIGRLADRRALDRSGSAPDAVARAWRRGYWLVAGAVALCGVLATGRAFLARHGLGPPLPHNDSVILEYVGIAVARGATLYVDVWEIKPPLAFVPSALFALATGGDPYAVHLLGIATTTLGFVVTAAFTARIVGRVTGSPVAGLAVGVTFLALPDLLYMPWLGYKAKIVVFALGTAALDRALAGRHGASGLLAGLSVGVWQLAVVFPLVTLLYARRDGARALRRQVAGGAVAAGVVGLTLLTYADPAGFLAEVVLGPLVLDTGSEPFDPGAYFGLFPTAIGRWLTLAGAVGLALALVAPGPGATRGDDPDGDATDGASGSLRVGSGSGSGSGSGPGIGIPTPTAAGPLVVGALVATLLVVFVDFDGLWDTVYPLTFTALGIGLLVGRLPRRAAAAAVVVLALVTVPVLAPSEFVRQDPVEMTPSDGLPPALDAEREHLYWTGQQIRSCRFFGADTQRSALRFYPDADTLADAPCGDLDRYWAAATRRAARLAPGTEPSGPPPWATPTPAPTPRPGLSVAGGFDYRVDGDRTVVTVPVANDADGRRTGAVAVEATVDGRTVERCRPVDLAAGGATTLRVVVDEPADGSVSLAASVRGGATCPADGGGTRTPTDRPAADVRAAPSLPLPFAFAFAPAFASAPAPALAGYEPT